MFKLEVLGDRRSIIQSLSSLRELSHHVDTRVHSDLLLESKEFVVAAWIQLPTDLNRVSDTSD